MSAAQPAVLPELKPFVTKACCRCKKEKTPKEYYNNRSTKTGKHPECKLCHKAKGLATYEKHKESRRERARTYYRNNRQKALTRNKEWLAIPEVAYKQLKYHSGRRKMEVTLTLDEFIAIISNNCAYGGASPSSVRMGIDRKDNSVGYTLSNSVPCCFLHNVIKHRYFTFEEMQAVLRAVPRLAVCMDKPNKGTIWNL